ncbi:hypothetical protein [Pseudodesulfovibrio sediminis]|uniref:Extracellular solute-binding protein n=1 Tax=Pseudodesulfovibrio sediminis TaxID=2810563 RepID=A0ABM7PAR5_9BACT|nr:hypothetical protein [Pseudodesulfovibrio sediminis]BCS90183.1 hypothetical protein PSDVSF_34250 [Pseudodesulfovibrio sediminis]
MRRIHTMMTFTRAARLLILLILLALLGFGCGPMKYGPIKSSDTLSTPNLLVEADAAWQAKRYEVAELYYADALERSDLVRSELPTVYSRLAKSAIENEHPQQARLALEAWGNIDTKVLYRLDWELPYLDAMAALDKTERLRNHLKWVLESDAVPWETKWEVGLWYNSYFIEKQNAERALDVLDGFYKQAPDDVARAGFEHEFLTRLQAMSDDDVEALSVAVNSANQWRFPYAMTAFERGVRSVDSEEAWPANWRTLRNISVNAELVDMDPLRSRLADLESRYGLPTVGLALALPVTGPYAKVGIKILRGTGLAQWRLAQDGVNVDIKVINTQIPGWEARLDALPDHYSVVGGPLRVNAFKRLYEAGSPGKNILKERAVFSFMGSLGDKIEGEDAWRFFTSRNDEVRSLVSLTVDQLGIRDLAVLYPEEKFGRTMSETFYREAAPLGGRIKGMQSYPSRELKQWSKRVSKLLKVPANFSENKDIPLEMPDFGAVFIPDGWSQAQTLLPNFFFYEGDQLVFLGPGLWSRALDSTKGIDEHYYRLAICPGAWWADSDGGRNLQNALTEEGLGKADFWVALGYDFIRFAGQFGVLPSNWDADDVNTRIQSAQGMDFSMAPITWTKSGVASQELFLFSPVRNGKQLVDVEKLKVRIAKAKARRERRMKAYEKRIDAKMKKSRRSSATNPDIPPTH